MDTSERILIVNADDFGQTSGVNRGIIEAHENGIVTSASLMVHGAAAEEAAEYVRRNSTLGIGLHLDLGEWTKREDGWHARYEVVHLNDLAAVRDELFRQLHLFRNLVGREPSHLDSHQHVHREGSARDIASELAHTLKVPLRHFSRQITYCGQFYGQPWQGQNMAQAVSVQALIAIIRSLRPGITELACHPAYPEGLESDYLEERVLEVQTLCHPEVRAAIASENILMRSFADSAAKQLST